MSDELVDEVRAALDPTPASDADWPVSRRRVLQGLASVGALSLGPGAASGAAGTASADQAFFSNYGATSTADGYDVTIDGDVFAFDGDDTIGLPDGGTGTELLTPSGAIAREVIGPDGSVVYEVTIPDSGGVQYLTDEGSGTTLNSRFDGTDVTITNPNWQTESGAVGGQYLAFNGSDAKWQTDQNLNITTFTIAGWWRPSDHTSFGNPFLGAIGNNDFNTDAASGFYINTEGTEGEILTSVTGDGLSAATQHRNHPFVNIGEWGFVALSYDAANNDFRLITWDNTQELSEDIITPDRMSDDSVPWHMGGDSSFGDFAEGDGDFTMLDPGRVTPKSELTELWEATQR